MCMGSGAQCFFCGTPGVGGYAPRCKDQRSLSREFMLETRVRDNHYGFFSLGKTDNYQPTMEAKSLTIYAQVQKSGVSSILSLSGTYLSCFAWTPWPISSLCMSDIHCSTWVMKQKKFGKQKATQELSKKALNFSVRWYDLLFEMTGNTGFFSSYLFLHRKKMRTLETCNLWLLPPLAF